MNDFLGIESPYTDYNSARAVVIPVPFEHTTSYGQGAKHGPQAIIDASAYVEFYDDEYDCEMYKSGVHTTPALNFTNNPESDFDKITEEFRRVLNDGKFPVGLGGEHSVSYPTYRAFHEKYDNISVLQFDAHSDLRESYEGTPYSHASVMRRIYDLNKDIVQVGIRSQCIEEAQFIKENRINTFFAHSLRKNGLSNDIIDRLNENVFITIDVDYFDPSIMPSTGTPEPGGFLWYETVDFLSRVFKKKNVVGFDVVELSPKTGVIHPDFFAAKLIYKMLTLKFL
ncbi:MAG: agmatinase [Calditrichaceae bacterium]